MGRAAIRRRVAMTALIDSKGPLGPTPERLWQGTVQRLQATVRDSEGGIGHPWRGLDTLSAMLARGSITSKMRQAGDRFHDLFRAASLDGLYSADLNRVPVQLNTSRMWLNGGGNEAARLSVLSGLDALGGMRCLAGPAPGMCWAVK